MGKSRTLFVYNTTYVNGEEVKVGRMLVGAKIAIVLMVSGISFLSAGIIMKLIGDDYDDHDHDDGDDHDRDHDHDHDHDHDSKYSSLYIGGIANIVFGSILVGCSLIALGIVYCQQKRQGNDRNTPYNPPIPGSYPTQTTKYPANPDSYPQTLQVQRPFGYPPPYTAQQVNPASSTSQPTSAASFSHDKHPEGVSDMASPLGFQVPIDPGHQKADDQQFTNYPPPYSP